MKDQVRVSMGTLKVLGLELLLTDADPETAYLQTYHPGKCIANCRFCAQARDASARRENIARGVYPPRDTETVVNRLVKAFEHGLLKRACIQTMNYVDMYDDLLYLIKELKERTDMPISVSVYPLAREKFAELRNLGVDRIVIPLDACTPELFDEIKGRKADSPYTWVKHMNSLDEAVRIFGENNVGTHLILGLGETEEEATKLIHELWGKGVYCALFAYTPIEKTQLKKKEPDIGHYRRIQLACYLIEKGLGDKVEFNGGRIAEFGLDKNRLDEIIDSGMPFKTKGCPNCNRPYSTETPGGLIYNYPRKPAPEEIEKIRDEIFNA